MQTNLLYLVQSYDGCCTLRRHFQLYDYTSSRIYIVRLKVPPQRTSTALSTGKNFRGVHPSRSESTSIWPTSISTIGWLVAAAGSVTEGCRVEEWGRVPRHLTPGTAVRGQRGSIACPERAAGSLARLRPILKPSSGPPSSGCTACGLGLCLWSCWLRGFQRGQPR